jgi:CubicO group peptidase (beta-lactamase class C family)
MSGLVSAGVSELAAKLNDFVTENRLPGATAAVVQGDELAWIAGTGFADQDTRQPSQPDTLYRIASITKTFTGTAVMQLRDAGRLDLDDPAVAYLPELRKAVSPFAAIETVTIRRMLSHESGLATEPPGTDWSVPLYQGAPEVTLAQAGNIVLTLPPSAGLPVKLTSTRPARISQAWRENLQPYSSTPRARTARAKASARSR